MAIRCIIDNIRPILASAKGFLSLFSAKKSLKFWADPNLLLFPYHLFTFPDLV